MSTSKEPFVDEHGYLTQRATTTLSEFRGSPQQLVKLVETMWIGSVVILEVFDITQDPITQIVLNPGASASNAEIVNWLRINSSFWFSFWQASYRSGSHIFEIGHDDWTAPHVWSFDNPHLEFESA